MSRQSTLSAASTFIVALQAMPEDACTLQQLSICRHGRTGTQHDAYDCYRPQPLNGFGLHDPGFDIPAAYDFVDGQVAFAGHFRRDIPANNSKGYQALWFDRLGKVEKFAYYARGILQTQVIGERFPDTARDIVTAVRKLKAPTCRQVLRTLCALDNDLFKSSLKPYLG